MHRFSLAELCDVVGESPRTVRYYIQQGLLPPPAGAGPVATYGPEHVDGIKAVRAMQRQHLPLATIRGRLEASRDEQPSAPDDATSYVQAALGLKGPPATATPPAFTQHTWERHLLTRDVELHVRRPLSRVDNRRVDQLLAFARTLFTPEENP
jgi:Ca-activated chloride channel family protein